MSAITVRKDTLYPKSPRLSFKIFGLFLALMLLLGLIAQAQAAQVTLAWDANSEPDLSGYKLYYGTSSGNYPNSVSLGLVTTYTVTNLSDGVASYFVLTAFDSEGFESYKSNEVSYTPPASSFTLTASAGTGGLVSPAGTSTVNYGENKTYTITPNSGFQIADVRVDGTLVSAVGTYTFSSVTANHTISATFTAITYTLTVGQTGTGTGTVTNAPAGTSFSAGTAVRLTAAPNTSSVFTGWTGGCSGTTNPCSVTMNTNTTVTALFAIKTYTVSVSKTGTGSGAVTNLPTGTTFNAGTLVSLTATADANSVFTGWSGACSGTTNPCTVTISATTSIQAAFNLETIKPTSSISSPAGGATLRHPAVAITGGATDGTGSGVQKVEVSTDGGSTWRLADGTILWSYSWNASGNGTYVIKSRATDNVGNVENPGAGATVTVAPYQPTPVDVSGKQLLVNGAPFTVKGVVYSPVPIGEDPNASPYGDYFTAPYSAIHNRDLPVLKAMGANVVRLYNWEKSADHFDFLDQAYNDGSDPIYVIAGYWINDGMDINPASPANVRDQIKADFQKMVAAHKDHPAILMWSVGQNLNLPQAYGNNLPQLFSLINELAEVAHLEEGTKAHPVTTALADQNLAATLAGYEEAVPALDLWGANVYRGNSFGTLFADSSPATQKPLLILEYGIDAYDNTRSNEYEKLGATTQADITEGLWKEIAAHGQTCVGGTIMSYSDEWWKGRYTGDTSCPADPDPSLHGRCGFPAATQPDGYANEEWWGIVRVLDNGTGPDRVEPRGVYYRLQYLWGTNALALASPNGGETWRVGQPQTIDWNYAGNPGAYVKIDLLKNGSVIRNIAKSAKIGANGTGSYTWTPPWKLKPGPDYKIRVTSNSNNQINDASDADFNLNSSHFLNSYHFVSK